MGVLLYARYSFENWLGNLEFTTLTHRVVRGYYATDCSFSTIASYSCILFPGRIVW